MVDSAQFDEAAAPRLKDSETLCPWSIRTALCQDGDDVASRTRDARFMVDLWAVCQDDVVNGALRATDSDKMVS